MLTCGFFKPDATLGTTFFTLSARTVDAGAAVRRVVAGGRRVVTTRLVVRTVFWTRLFLLGSSRFAWGAGPAATRNVRKIEYQTKNQWSITVASLNGGRS